eukprot:scaffold5330_cov125-Isochrysis_galbana.AAC.3
MVPTHQGRCVAVLMFRSGGLAAAIATVSKASGAREAGGADEWRGTWRAERVYGIQVALPSWAKVHTSDEPFLACIAAHRERTPKSQQPMPQWAGRVKSYSPIRGGDGSAPLPLM